MDLLLKLWMACFDTGVRLARSLEDATANLDTLSVEEAVERLLAEGLPPREALQNLREQGLIWLDVDDRGRLVAIALSWRGVRQVETDLQSDDEMRDHELFKRLKEWDKAFLLLLARIKAPLPVPLLGDQLPRCINNYARAEYLEWHRLVRQTEAGYELTESGQSRVENWLSPPPET